MRVRTHLKRTALWSWAVFARCGRKSCFRGAFATFDDAAANVRPGMLAGYDHDRVTEVSREVMQEVPLWDYPILYWLQRLTPRTARASSMRAAISA